MTPPKAMTRLERLEQICKMVAAERPILGKPYTIDLDGVACTIGSDGHGLAVFRELPEPRWSMAPAGPPNFLEVIRHAGLEAVFTLGQGPAGAPIDLVALRDWTAEAAPVTRAQCPACEGSGQLVCGECEGEGCEACGLGSGGKESCYVCDGEPQFKPGHIGRVRLNRGVLWKWLSWVTQPIGATLWFPAKYQEPLVFRGEDWFLLVMPLKTYDGDTYPAEPRFPWSPASVVGAPR